MVNSDKEWRARCDLDTLQRAEEIKKSRIRMRAAQAQAKKDMDNLKKVASPQRKPARKRAPRKR